MADHEHQLFPGTIDEQIMLEARFDAVLSYEAELDRLEEAQESINFAVGGLKKKQEMSLQGSDFIITTARIHLLNRRSKQLTKASALPSLMLEATVIVNKAYGQPID